MGAPPRIDPAQTRVRPKVAEARPPPKVAEARPPPKGDFGSRIKEEGAPAPEVSTTPGTAAASLHVPGSAILSAAMNGRNPAGSPLSSRGAVRTAVRGASGTRARSSKTPAATSESVPTVPSDTASQGMELVVAQQCNNLQFLILQSKLSRENREYSASSNVIKADPANNTIQNIH